MVGTLRSLARDGRLQVAGREVNGAPTALAGDAR
jgi:hypothetical protein